MTRKKITLLLSLIFLSNLSFAQSEGSGNFLLYSGVALGIFLMLWTFVSLSDSLLRIEAEKSGIDPVKNNIGVIPNVSNLFKKSISEFIDGKLHILSKGFDIKLKGRAQSIVDYDSVISRHSLQPQNFLGMSPIPKVVVSIGDEVKVGDEIFFDKKRPEIKYTAPVSGEIVDIVRGAKRSISDVIILADKDMKYRSFDIPNIENCNREDIVEILLESGCWTMINQRPFDIVPDHGDIPANIFISCFSTAPLAADRNVLIEGKEADFQKGLDVLNKLTVGKIYLGLDAKKASIPSFANANGVERHFFKGKHPAGNVGIQIHHIDPIKNEKIWTLGVQEVASIGALFNDGKADFSRTIAITGSEVLNPKYVSTHIGANIGDLLKENISGNNIRIISGDVLTGKKANLEGFINFRNDQITIIKEGDYFELLGWLIPFKLRPSISKSLPGFLMPNYMYEGDTNTHGEKRAFVVTGQYESVLPMDIYPQHLMKAILVNDFERMEGLGINELSEEDIALCEFVCTSKQPLQSILRKGLDMMQEQL